MNLRWLLHAKRWSLRPPSARRVKIIFGIIAFCLALAGLEYLGVLPDWMGIDPRAARGVGR